MIRRPPRSPLFPSTPLSRSFAAGPRLAAPPPEHRVPRALGEHTRNRRARRTVLDELLGLRERGAMLLRPSAVPARFREEGGRLGGRLDISRGEERVARLLERLDTPLLGRHVQRGCMAEEDV